MIIVEHIMRGAGHVNISVIVCLKGNSFHSLLIVLGSLIMSIMSKLIKNTSKALIINVINNSWFLYVEL